MDIINKRIDTLQKNILELRKESISALIAFDYVGAMELLRSIDHTFTEIHTLERIKGELL